MRLQGNDSATIRRRAARLLAAAYLFLFGSLVSAQVQPDADSLLGIHWYGNTDSLQVGESTDVEAMTAGRGVWILEITHVDPAATAGAPWLAPAYYVGHSQKAVSEKGHSLVFRMQPYWSVNVPHPDDPFGVDDFAREAKAGASTLRDWCHIWQIGNEVNILGENRRWGGSAYDGPTWEPTPEAYAATYVAARDRIHELDAETSPTVQVVLMQPPSPGAVVPGVRYMDGNEFLWRQIAAVEDPAKIDGFALHGYADPATGGFGAEGWLDSVREQLMIIDALGFGDRPVYITEFNRHMPNETEARAGAKFLGNAYAELDAWNDGSGGAWPGEPNHPVVAATWFVYPDGFGWDDYALQHWKGEIASTSATENPWYAFQAAAMLDYPAGAGGGGASPESDALWWRDSFEGVQVDRQPPLPDWRIETTGGGSAVATGGGQVRLLGNGSATGGATLRTAGYVYGDFRLVLDFEITNAARAHSSIPEANFDLRLREGSRGYSLTFFTAGSPTNTNRIVLRRTNEWSQIGGFATDVPGGIQSGDRFLVDVAARGSTLRYRVYKNGNSGAPVVAWEVEDSGERVGNVRAGTYNLNEARLNDFLLGGPDWLPGYTGYKAY